MSTSTASSTTGKSEQLDLSTIMKAAEAISSEVVLERVITRIMEIAIENAGAQRGCLLLEGRGQLLAEAAAAVGQGVSILQSAPLDEAKDVSAGVVRYVERTHQAVVLANAAREGRFMADPYVVKVRPRSVLCVPVLRLGRLVGVLYLENNLADGAFSPARIEILRVLSSQAAIAIENSRLYGELEEKVKERTAELVEAQAKLVRLEREATEKRMAGGFAHEIRNALAGSSLVLEKAAGESGDDKESLPLASAQELHALFRDLKTSSLPELVVDPMLGRIRTIFDHQKTLDGILHQALRATARALGITRQIMEYSRLEERIHARNVVPLSDIVTHLVADTKACLKDRDVAIHSDVETDVMVMGDEALYYSILQNLLNNARDAIVEKSGSGVIHVRAKTEGARCILQVEDNGVGIRATEIGNIFDAFYSTKPETGTGLGLAVVKRIVESSGGDIQVESAWGEGSQFTISLPIAGAAWVSSEARETAA
jgi:signal transduction histidine kinase